MSDDNPFDKRLTELNELQAENERLRKENTRLKGMLISGFYENEYPEYSQGEPTMELQEVVKADELNHIIDEMKNLHEIVKWKGDKREY